MEIGHPSGKQVKCLNCGTLCHDKYCPKCGQETSTRRFQVKDMFESIITSIFGGGNKLLNTCSALLYRPGHMAREYLLGRRVSYYKPMSLLLFLVAIYAIAVYFFTDAVSPFDIFRTNVPTNDISSTSAGLFMSYFQMLIGNNLYFAIFAVLINLLPYRFIFRNQKLLRPTGTCEPLNVAEHFFALIYQTCFNMMLAFILLPLGAFEDGKTWVARFSLFMPTLYCVILYKQLLGITWMKSLWLNILAVLLSICLNITLLLGVFGVLYGIDNIASK